jgi:lipopolysaccharide export system permease protein
LRQIFNYFSVKKIDKLAIFQFLGPFIVTFCICIFILLMQWMWKYVDDLVGKGLEIYVILELLFYASAQLIPMALPLAVLLSAIMTFGTLAENNELMAMKSSGVSTLRVVFPIAILVVGICWGSYQFANHILPQANLKFGSLLWDIKTKKPAFDIKPNVFYDGIEGYRIRVGSKSSNSNKIYDVLIYDHTSGIGNNIVTVAESGEMNMSLDNKWLNLKLFNGSRYEDVREPGINYKNYPFSRTKFREYEIRFDLSSFQFTRSSSNLFRGNYKMLNIRELVFAADSVEQKIKKLNPGFADYMAPFYYYLRDTLTLTRNPRPLKMDSLNFICNFPAKDRDKILETALNTSRNVKGLVSFAGAEMLQLKKTLVKYNIEFHRKIALAYSIFVLFLIGAPLGAIIRKGGLGLPAVISMLLFILHYILSITGEKLAKEFILTPFWGMWLPIFIIFPVGVFLLYKANKDSKLFNKEAYERFVTWLSFSKLTKLLRG